MVAQIIAAPAPSAPGERSDMPKPERETCAIQTRGFKEKISKRGPHLSDIFDVGRGLEKYIKLQDGP